MDDVSVVRVLAITIVLTVTMLNIMVRPLPHNNKRAQSTGVISKALSWCTS